MSTYLNRLIHLIQIEKRDVVFKDSPINYKILLFLIISFMFIACSNSREKASLELTDEPIEKTETKIYSEKY